MIRPELIPIDTRKNQDSAYILSRGLGSENKKGAAAHAMWISQLRTLGFQGSIYQYWWDSSPYTFTYNKYDLRNRS